METKKRFNPPTERREDRREDRNERRDLDLNPDRDWQPEQKLVTLPTKVWEDVKQFIWTKYKMNIPKANFRFTRFLHSRNFDYTEYVQSLTPARAAILFALLGRKLGVGMLNIQNKDYSFVATDDDNLQLVADAYRKTVSKQDMVQMNGQKFDPNSLMDRVEQLDIHSQVSMEVGRPATDPDEEEE